MKSFIRPVYLFILLVLFFIAIIGLAPADTGEMQRLGLAATSYRWFFFLLELPLVLVWLAALYSYKKLQQYADTIADSPESDGFHGLSRGCRWLAWGMMLSGLISAVLVVATHSQIGFQSGGIILGNYLNLIFLILAFSIMSSSTMALKRSNAVAGKWWQSRPLQLLLVIIGVAYSFLILRNQAAAPLNSSVNQFFLPTWLVIVSLIIPYLYACFMGLLTVFDVILLARDTPGIIYRRALATVAAGLVLVICSLMAAQYMRSLVPAARESAASDLAATYAVYILSIAGFILVALGTRRMRRIEEV